MLTPADIDKKQFTTTRIKEGYDQAEVDEFLDRVVVDYARTVELLRDANGRAERLKTALEATSDAPTQMLPTTGAERILVAAQRTAELVEAEAREEADRIVREAGGKAAQVIEEADEAARKIRYQVDAEVSVARTNARDELNQIAAQRDQLKDEIAQLEEARRQHRSWLQATLAQMDEKEATDG